MLFRRTLVPVDFSDRSLPALRLALALSRETPDARITVLHVTTPREPMASGAFAELLAAVDHGNVHIDVLATDGAPAAKIVGIAGEGHFDAIILGTRRRAGVADYLGPVAMPVIAAAPCPVITIAPDMASSAPRQIEQGVCDDHAFVD